MRVVWGSVLKKTNTELGLLSRQRRFGSFIKFTELLVRFNINKCNIYEIYEVRWDQAKILGLIFFILLSFLKVLIAMSIENLPPNYMLVNDNVGIISEALNTWNIQGSQSSSPYDSEVVI